MSRRHKGKRSRRRSSKGFLSRMRDAPNRPSKQTKSPFRKVVEWTFGLLAAAAILAAVVLLGVRFLVPDLGAEIREATVEIEEVVSAEDSGIGIEIPIVLLEDAPTMLRIRAKTDVEAGEGDRVHVTYEFRPLAGSVIVQAWEVTEKAD